MLNVRRGPPATASPLLDPASLRREARFRTVTSATVAFAAMARTVRAYSITADAVARERERVGGAIDDMDVANVIALDKLELRDMGPSDVHMRILAASAEHNVDHAAMADTINIAESRGGRIYPGNSAVGEVLEVGADVTRFKPGDIVITHCNGEPDKFGYPLRIWAYDQPESVGWYAEEAVVGRLAAAARRRSTAGSACGRSPRCRCARRPPSTCGAAPSASTG